MKKRLALALLSLSAAVFWLGTNGFGSLGGTPRAEAAAYSLTVVDQQCLSASSVRMFFNWGSYNEGPQWMDLSLSNNDFAPGTFVGVGPIPVGQNSFTWDGLLPGLTHYIRINTLTPSGWSTSQTFSFTTRGDCSFVAPVPPPAPVGIGASNLSANQSCLPSGQPHVSLNWFSSNQGQQWLDNSQYSPNFEAGTFPSVGPFAPNQSNYEWDGLQAGSLHFIRINTGTPGGWLGSNVVTLVVRTDCTAAAPASTATPAPAATSTPHP
jgi:hypothetical protein